MITNQLMVLASMSFQELRLDRMSRSFGNFAALSEINLTIKKGEFIALLGPSDRKSVV